jgi:hypothetical protein
LQHNRPDRGNWSGAGSVMVWRATSTCFRQRRAVTTHGDRLAVRYEPTTHITAINTWLR